MRSFAQAKESILRSKSVVVSGHINPDGDSIGSILSLGLGIERLGKRVHVVSPDGVPRRYKGLPGADRIVRKTPVIPDLAIGVDCGGKELLGSAFETFRKAKTVLEIDHHEFRKPFGDINLVDHNAAAVGELVYILLNEMKISITKDIAQNILTSIIVETNSFRLPNIRPLTFEICAELVDIGVNFYKLVETVFWSRSKAASALLGICLSRCRFLKEEQMVWSVIKKEDFDKVGGKDEDLDPVVDEMRSISKVKVAVLFRERRGNIFRVSLRSKGRINVAALAERYKGGGHYDAAGCYIKNTDGSIREFLKAAESLIK
jgi:phosphoesterase RecJ-like protein